VGRPEELAHWLLIHLEVQEAMERLPELQRQALILYAEEGLAYAEIAEIMETSVGTVKSRLHYAKKLLRGLLRPETLRSLDEELTA
jgi:RNA polymerase sigma-70 factor (ECF subfamily)